MEANCVNVDEDCKIVKEIGRTGVYLETSFPNDKTGLLRHGYSSFGPLQLDTVQDISAV